MHTALTSDEWRQSADQGTDAEPAGSESSEPTTMQIASMSSGLFDSGAVAHGASTRAPGYESYSDYPYCRELRDS
jgi:hypothetical protein